MQRRVSALLLSLLCTPALAGPWLTAVEFPDDPTYLAHQDDPQSGAMLIADCYYDMASAGFRVVANVPWDPDASYAPDVEPVFTIDGTDYSGLKFRFYEYGGLESIFAEDWDQHEAFNAIYKAMMAATQPITVRYFDKLAVFSPEGINAALTDVVDRCDVDMP